MCKRHVLLVVLTLLLIGQLTLQVVAPTLIGIPPAARAQEFLMPAAPYPGVPYPVTSYPGAPLLLPSFADLAPAARDPASVASELLLTDAPPGVLPQPRPEPRWAGQSYVSEVGSSASHLRRRLVQFKQDVAVDQQTPRWRELSRGADDALDALDAFEERLRVGRARVAVAEDYAAVEARVRALTRDAQAAGLGGPAGRGPAGWFALADERLGEAVNAGQEIVTLDPALVARESDNLVFGARATCSARGNTPCRPGRAGARCRPTWPR
jgi:hypothetical protein